MKKYFYFTVIKIWILLCFISVCLFETAASAADVPAFVKEMRKIAIPLDKQGMNILIEKAGDKVVLYQILQSYFFSG